MSYFLAMHFYGRFNVFICNNRFNFKPLSYEFSLFEVVKGDKNWHVAYVVFIVCFEC